VSGGTPPCRHRFAQNSGSALAVRLPDLFMRPR
jgi:hypothetical protein